jgi:hypothetical protein
MFIFQSYSQLHMVLPDLDFYIAAWAGLSILFLVKSQRYEIVNMSRSLSDGVSTCRISVLLRFKYLNCPKFLVCILAIFTLSWFSVLSASEGTHV